MSINISQGFKRTSANPVDESLTLTKAQMLAVNDNLMPSKYFTVGQEDGYIYLYDKSNTADPETGKYRKFEGGGGGGGASSMSDLDDVLLTALADGQTLIWDNTGKKWVNGNMPSVDNCYQTTDPDNGTNFENEDKIPLYNVSISGKRHFTWANLKVALKTYFDTLYSTLSTNIQNPTDGQLLKYDATSGKWINGSGGSVSVTSLGDIQDVNLSNIADGQIIRWDATTNKWVNANAPKERELTQAEYNALSQQEKMNGTTYYITDGEGGGAYSVQSATLSAGETTVTFTVPTTGNYLLNVYTSDGRDYTDVDTSVSGSVTLTFNAPSSNVTVYLEAKEV